MTFWRNVLPNMLLHGQNALLVVSTCLQNFYQCRTVSPLFHRVLVKTINKSPLNWSNLTHTLSNSLHNYLEMCITSRTTRALLLQRAIIKAIALLTYKVKNFIWLLFWNQHLNFLHVILCAFFVSTWSSFLKHTWGAS